MIIHLAFYTHFSHRMITQQSEVTLHFEDLSKRTEEQFRKLISLHELIAKYLDQMLNYWKGVLFLFIS